MYLSYSYAKFHSNVWTRQTRQTSPIEWSSVVRNKYSAHVWFDVSEVLQFAAREFDLNIFVSLRVTNEEWEFVDFSDFVYSDGLELLLEYVMFCS